MNKSEIVTVLYELHKITGFRISLHNADFKEIAAFPEDMLPFCKKVQEISGEYAKCLECDRTACEIAIKTGSTHIYKCRFGLTEAVSPLYNFGTLTGFLMMGQICDEKSDTAQRHLCALTGDPEEARQLTAKIPLVDATMVSSYVRIMTICAQYLTLSNAIPNVKPTVAELAKKYVNEHIDQKICIKDICDELNCSKSTLLTGFKSRYGITVNTYVTDIRLDKAQRLLCEGAMTISEISRETGFSDQSYFSKVFSAKYGMPPSEYRIAKMHEATKG